MRARYPDAEGYIQRDGVRVFYEVYGEGDPPIVFLPTWAFVHSRVWRMQIHYFARRHRVVVFDPRGNGRSDRPPDLDSYAERQYAQDALDVMDETGAERALVVGLSRGAQRGLLLAADHPERVIAVAFVGPLFPVSRRGRLRWRGMWALRNSALARRLLPPRGWGKFNPDHWRRDYRDFVEWFARRVASQAHSTKPFDDACEWALETDPETLGLTAFADLATPMRRGDQLALARRVSCPVLVICGTDDRVTGFADARALARAANGKLVPIAGGDHIPEGRRPVEVNLALRAFFESVGDSPQHADPGAPGASAAPASIQGGGR